MPRKRTTTAPPRPTPAAPLPGPIWQTLTDEQRQKIL